MGIHYSNQFRRSASENTPETAIKTKLKREKDETDDSCYVYADIDIQKQRSARSKYLGHEQSIPVDEFNVQHLPYDVQDNAVIDYVQVMKELTVCVKVNYVSDKRPKTYPCYSERGSYMMRTGTGWVSEVLHFPNISDINKACECKECLNSPAPKKQFAHILIRTPAHVVYDKLEAAHTTCYLFFDRGGSPDDCSGVVTLSDFSDMSRDTKTEYCVMKFVSHDLDLVNRLEKMVGYSLDIKKKLNKICVNPMFSMVSHIEPSTTTRTLSITVAHPDGCSKQVIIGNLTKRDNSVIGDQNTHTTTTLCQGSDGALIVMCDYNSTIKVRYSSCATLALLAAAFILCVINIVLAIIHLEDLNHITQEVLEYKHNQPEICIKCAQLYGNNTNSTNVNPLFDLIEKRWEDGVQKCCAITPEQMAAIIEMIAREYDIKTRYTPKGENTFTFSPISAHKQLHAPVVGDNLTEPKFYDGNNEALLLPDKNDPLIEHARGVKVTRDSMIIQYPGLYYIYSSVHYRTVSDRPAEEFQYQSGFTYIHRNSITNNHNSGTLLQTAHSVCEKCTGNEETSFTGGTFYLDLGDEIQVYYSSLSMVQINIESTFMGLMMLGSGCSQEQSYG